MSAIAELTQAARAETDQMELHYRAAAGDRVSSLASGGVVLGQTRLMAAVLGEDAVDREFYSHYRGWPYAAIRPIAQTIAGQMVHVGREVAKGTKPTRGHIAHKSTLPAHLKRLAGMEIEQYEEHLLLEAIERPNPIMVDWHLLYTLVASLELVGKHHWWVTAGKDRPVIWPLPASWIQPEHKENRPFARWLITPGGQGEPLPVPPEEVVLFYYPDPADPMGSVSPTQSQSRAISADESLQEAQARVFLNAPFPKHALIMGDVTEDGENIGRPTLEHEQRQQLYSEFNRMYRDVVHYGLPIILDRLVQDIRPLGDKPNEMDFLDSGKSTKGRITQGYGTNPVIMGELEGVNRASSYEARRHFADHTINPKIDLSSKVLTRALAPIFAKPGEKLRIWIEPYQPDDREERRRDIDLAAKYQAISRSEIRERLPRLALGPLEDGDDIPAPMMQPRVPVRRTLPDQKALSEEDPCVKVWLKQHGEHERSLADDLEKLFAEQREDVVHRLVELLGDDKAARPKPQEGLSELIFNPDEWEERFVEVCRPHLERSMLAGAAGVLSQVKSGKAAPSVDDLRVQLTSAVQGAIDTELETILTRPYWPEIQATTRAQLAATLSEGVTAGESLYELTVRIGDSPTVPVPGGADGVLGSASNTIRALNIARTETTGALNAGQFTQQEELFRDGVTDGMEWMTVIDQYARDSHVALNGKRAPGDFPVGRWSVGGYDAPYPGHHSLPAAERCNCRCTLSPVVG